MGAVVSGGVIQAVQAATDAELKQGITEISPELRERLVMCVGESLDAGSETLHARLAELLTKGCDDRIIVNPKTGMHKYNGTNCPVPGSVRRSSCTFNVPTEDAFQEGAVALRRVDGDTHEIEKLQAECCERMRKVWSVSKGDAISMFPSGTDAEFLPLLVALSRSLKSDGDKKIVSIITCAGEVGSGTKNASLGRHFSPLQATDSTHKLGSSIFVADQAPRIEAVDLKLRNAEGVRHDIDTLDSIVNEAVEKAIEVDGYSVALVHMVTGSKTGRLMPSLELMKGLSDRFGKKVLLVADACQVRMVDEGLRNLVKIGFAVLVTGSKFYGGPPFCGAALLPAAMAEELDAALVSDAAGGGLRSLVEGSTLKDYIGSSLVAPELGNLRSILPEATPNLGLVLRWHMALYHIEEYHKIPQSSRDAICQRWLTQATKLVSEKAYTTISVRSDPSTSSDNKLRRRITVEARGEAQMMQFPTIILLELRKPTASGEMELLGVDDLKKMHTLMATDLSSEANLPKDAVLAKRFFLAQPVTLSASVHVLRVAIGAPLVVRLYRQEVQGCADEEFHNVKLEDAALYNKMDLLLQHCF